MYASEQTYIWIFTYLVWTSIQKKKKKIGPWRSVTVGAQFTVKHTAGLRLFFGFFCQIAEIFSILENEFVAFAKGTNLFGVLGMGYWL